VPKPGPPPLDLASALAFAPSSEEASASLTSEIPNEAGEHDNDAEDAEI